MPVLQWAILCSRAITDQETNTISYIDAIEGISVSGFPFPFPPVCVSTLWRRQSERDTLSVRIRIQDPSGQTIQSFEPDSPISMDKKRHRLNVILGGAQIKGPGEYLIVIEQRAGESAETWKQEQVLPIDVSPFAPAKAVQ